MKQGCSSPAWLIISLSEKALAVSEMRKRFRRRDEARVLVACVADHQPLRKGSGRIGAEEEVPEATRSKGARRERG